MVNHICIISQRYPCKATPTVHVFVQRLAWAIRDIGLKVSVISPVPVNSLVHRDTEKRYTELTEKGYAIDVYRPRYVYFGSKKRCGIPLARISAPLFIKACISAVKEFKDLPDVFYGHFIVLAGIAACALADRFDKRGYIAYGESTDLSLVQYGLKRIRSKLINVGGIVAVSTKNKTNLIDNRIVSPERIRVFVNGVNTERFYPRDKTEARKKFGLSASDFVVSFVGQFIERKGIHLVRQAVGEIEGVKALFAGQGPLVPNGSCVAYASSLKPDEVPWLLSASDVFVLPSSNEGCSNALIEAMACGLPIIAANLAFNYDILDSSNSILVDISDSSYIKEAIIQLMRDKVRRKAMADASLRKAKFLSIERRAHNIIDWMG